MTKIHIGAPATDSSLSAEVEPGGALLVGRAPDPSRIDWSGLATLSALGAGPLTPSANYRVQSLTIPSGELSANHLLVLGEAALTVVYDLSSRNGSWLKLDPQRPVAVTAEQELWLALAGTALREPPLGRPREAQWLQEADFGAAVASALTDWFAQIAAPVRVIHHEPQSPADGFMLADDSVIELKEYATLQVAGATLLELVSAYVHDQNARFLQIGRRVSGMVAASPAIRQILVRTAEAAANCRRTLFLGPTGVGKELLARSYHAYSPYHAGPFVPVNCALLAKDLLYAQLFGARRGSFTGAVTDVPGFIEAANGGTLFLDELGEMTGEVQKALLRFLDSRGEYQRLGDPRPRSVDVRVIGASNVPLDDPAYRSGRFRDDLWYRLASSVIMVPPLRERPEDVRAFLGTRTLHGGKWSVAQCLNEEALALVVADPWPGNFRDLENFIDRLPRAASPRSITQETCALALREGRPRVAAAVPATAVMALSKTSPPAAIAVPQPGSAASPGNEPPRRSTAVLRTPAAVPTNDALGWERIVTVALRTFLEDQGTQPTGWDQLQLLVERYLKPMFVAHAAAPKIGAGDTAAINYSALARRLHIGDGGTVKTHLSRFQERFAPGGAADEHADSTYAGAPSSD